MPTAMAPKTTWRDSTVVDRYLSRQSTMVTVRMTAALKERLDDRVRLECTTGRRMSLNELCVQALVSVLDQLDAAEALEQQITETMVNGGCDTVSQ